MAEVLGVASKKIGGQWPVIVSVQTSQRSLLGPLPRASLKPIPWRTPPKSRENGPRERVLTPLELAEVWMVLGTDDFSNIVRLLILTGQRREEIGGLRWGEVDFERGLIVLPPGRTKNKRQHELPLVAASQRYPVRRKAIDGRQSFGCYHVWAGILRLCLAEGQRGFSGWGYSKGEARRAHREAQREAGGAKPMPKWTLHDLRRTAATITAENPRRIAAHC